ncbi:hypothetical protein CAPTEDRAFT_196003 [Capitella teleta]|uniref:Bis(5'-adenosyl)-triphosphatase n=1 Tax=Capitella teleta TaxID=283909 RepID=R7VAM3_CAPTE|nr:hypothetical protein CAPTEDRAFT_196003 [Capitella teleta]|eukprot:ELU15893.1 hypothetical protein CAPTEDRAFT_196003 [Capitella teleta]
MTSTPDKEHNFHVAKNLIQQAKDCHAKMVFLPECFDYVGESRAQTLSQAESLDGELMSRYGQLARDCDLWLSLGGFHEKANDGTDRIYNTHVVLDSSGNIRSTYRKIHLFDVDIAGGVRLKETDSTVPGFAITSPVSTPAGKVGLGICYDLRFPQLSLCLTQQGAQVLTYPSAFTVPTGQAHWQVLLRSRAIENQCYVIAAAQVGRHHAKRSSFGHSMVVDPWGKVIAKCQDKVDICIAELNFDLMKTIRAEMPVNSHQRPDLYGRLQALSPGTEEIESKAEYTFGQHSVKSSHVFYKTPLSIAFVNKKPVLPGHVLLAPIRRAERFSDLSPSEVSDLFQAVHKVSSVIEGQFGGTALTVAIQDGADAGQTVTHCHVHILPRKKGDFEDNDDVYDKLEKHDKEVMTSKWRTDEEMSKEATLIRKNFTS